MTCRRTAVVLLTACAFLAGCATVPPAAPPAPPAPPTSASVGDTTIVAIQPPAKSKQCCSLIDLLGVSQIGRGVVGLAGRIGSRVRSALGNRFPGLEAKPPLLQITDPANLSENASPGVKSAAQVKQDAETAPQKVKAVRFLTRNGCSCHKGVAEAIVGNLTDCSEVVRYETVRGLREAARRQCGACQGNSCCSEVVQKELRRIAYETNDDGCFLEPSSRVRRLARLALATCPAIQASSQDGADGAEPEEGPEPEAGAPVGAAEAPAPAPAPATPTPPPAPTPAPAPAPAPAASAPTASAPTASAPATAPPTAAAQAFDYSSVQQVGYSVIDVSGNVVSTGVLPMSGWTPPGAPPRLPAGVYSRPIPPTGPPPRALSAPRSSSRPAVAARPAGPPPGGGAARP